MRDPNRIGPMLEALARVWMEYPDYRLGQLIDNVSYTYRPHGQQSVFFVEDDDMLAALETAAAAATSSNAHHEEKP